MVAAAVAAVGAADPETVVADEVVAVAGAIAIGATVIPAAA